MVPVQLTNVVKQNRLLLMIFLAPKAERPIVWASMAIDNVILKLTILQSFKMGPVLVADNDSDQTVAFITITSHHLPKL